MKFKNDHVAERYKLLHPKLQYIAAEMDAWMQEKFQHEITLTCAASTIKEDQDDGREHAGHRERRAVDIRANDWEPGWCRDFEIHFENMYRGYAAIGVSSGKTNLVEFHGKGSNFHAHVQLSHAYALPPLEPVEETKDKI